MKKLYLSSKWAYMNAEIAKVCSICPVCQGPLVKGRGTDPDGREWVEDGDPYCRNKCEEE